MDDATRRVGAEATRTKSRPRASQPTEAVAASADTDQRTQEIREEIAQTRDNMSETLDAIQDRLKPANLVAQAGETVRNATTEKVKQMANTAGQAADQVMGSSFMETMRSNPVPAALIGIGAAWLFFSGRSKTRTAGRFDRAGGQRDWRTLGAGGVDYRSGDAIVATSGTGESGRSVGEYVGELSSRAERMTNSLGHSAERAGHRARVGFDQVMRDNPLALGAAAAIVGAAIAMSIPNTDAENELMGEARDNVVERARTVATDAANKVKDAAGQVQDIASHAVETVAPGTTGSNRR
jgi:hypothetical protein